MGHTWWPHRSYVVVICHHTNSDIYFNIGKQGGPALHIIYMLYMTKLFIMLAGYLKCYTPTSCDERTEGAEEITAYVLSQSLNLLIYIIKRL